MAREGQGTACPPNRDPANVLHSFLSYAAPGNATFLPAASKMRMPGCLRQSLSVSDAVSSRSDGFATTYGRPTVAVFAIRDAPLALEGLRNYMTKKWIRLLLVLAFMFTASVAHAQHNVGLTWTPSTSAVGNPSLTYNVFRSSGCTGAFSLLNTTPISASSFLDVAVPPGTYCYQATAVLAGLQSSPSNEASAVVPGVAVVTVPPGASGGCQHRGPLIGWIRCIGSRPHGRR